MNTWQENVSYWTENPKHEFWLSNDGKDWIKCSLRMVKLECLDDPYYSFGLGNFKYASINKPKPDPRKYKNTYGIFFDEDEYSFCYGRLTDIEEDIKPVKGYCDPYTCDGLERFQYFMPIETHESIPIDRSKWDKDRLVFGPEDVK